MKESSAIPTRPPTAHTSCLTKVRLENNAEIEISPETEEEPTMITPKAEMRTMVSKRT